ncbi:MAG: CPBP family intramembrane metalloprotease [Bacteroidetes bacterium]|nr:CPBP family intramembrane metalloprotease [Bacteroidota bacterium]
MDNLNNPSRKHALLAGLKPGEKILFAVVNLFILGLLFQFLGAFIAALLYDFRVSEILSMGAFTDPKYVAASKLIQILGSVGTFIIPAFLFSYLFGGDLFSYYQFRDPINWVALFLTVGMMVSVIPLINYLAEVNMRMEFPINSVDRIMRRMEADAEQIMRAFTATKSLWGLLMNLLMIGVIAAFGEELIFRGLFQRLLTSMVRSPHLAILITAILFSAFHFQFFSFLPRFALGIILGYLMYLGRSIWFPIIAHFLNNAMGVIYYYFNSKGSADDMLEEIGTSTMLPMTALISLLIFVVFFIAWYYQVSVNSSRSPRSVGSGTD